jgi:phosphate-selective porin OprO/OprP
MSKKQKFTSAALAALAAAGGVVVTGGVAYAQTAPTIQPMSGAPEIRDGEQRFKIRGRLQYDVYSNEWDAGVDSPLVSPSVDAEDGSRSYVRRAFIGAQGRFSDNWRYKVDFVLNPGASGDDAATGDAAVAVDDAYLEYAGDFFSVVIGENNVTSPLEDRTSSLDIPFLERSSIINAYGYGRAAGVAGLVTGANWMAALGVYGDSLNNSDSSFATSEQTSVSGRFTWAPIFETAPDGVTLLHLGVSARQRYNGDDALYRYRPRPLNGRGSRWVESSSGNATQSDTAYGFEVAGQWNAFGFTAEYITLEGETPAGVQIDSDGYYVDVTWSLTGEARSYRGNQGAFGPVVPSNPVTEGGWGHWGLIARYDSIDLTDVDAGTARGEQTAYAFGVNWVPVDHVRLMLNYASTEMDRSVNTFPVAPAISAPDAEADVISLRTQFDF